MNKTNNERFWWALGGFLIGCFVLIVVEPPTDHSKLQCDRRTEGCTIERSALFHTTVQTIQMKDIRYAHFQKLGVFIRGYHGPEIKLHNGSDISIGAGSTSPFTSEEQKITEEINNYLSNTELRTLAITQKGIPTVFIASLFMLGGILSLYKALKPYVKTNDNEHRCAYNKGIETDAE